MIRARAILDSPVFQLACAALFAVAVLFPGLGSQGFWEPHEIAVADDALAVLSAGDKEPPVAEAISASGRPTGQILAGIAKIRTEIQKWPPAEPLSMRAAAKSMGIFGPGELAARLPLALMGLATVIIAFALGARIASPRAGLFAALMLIAMPLFIFESRQLTSHIGAILGSAALAFGAIGLAWPVPRPRPWALAVAAGDALLLVLGAWLSARAAGAFVGLAVPFSGLAIAGAVTLTERRQREPTDPAATRKLFFATLACTAIAVLALLVTVGDAFDIASAYPGDRAIFGHTLLAENGHIAALGGAWKEAADRRSEINAVFEQLAFGMFPWIAIAPIAIIALSMPRQKVTARRAFFGRTLGMWAFLAWAACTFLARWAEPILFPAVVAVAVATAVWLDTFLSEAKKWPVIATFALLAPVVIAINFASYPDKLPSLPLATGTLKMPDAAEILSLHLASYTIILVIAALFSVALFVGIGIWRPRPGRAHVWKEPTTVALALGCVLAMFIAHGWMRVLSRQYSSKHIFDVYHELSHDDPLGIFGNQGSGPDYYADTDYVTLRSRTQLTDFLKQGKRVFALAPRRELCPIHEAAGAEGFSYYVLDDENATQMLLSNQLAKGETDKDPLRRLIMREPPAGIGHPLNVNFDNKIQLIGVSMPTKIEADHPFEVSFYFKVLAPIHRDWKIFVHFQPSGSGVRFLGDHDPINDYCATRYWQVGDYIIDTFTAKADVAGRYTAHMGFFVGSDGNYTNMTVVSGTHDTNNRVPVGSFTAK